MTDRHANGFRMSDTFIQRGTRAIVVCMVTVPMLGIALGFASDGDWAPEWLGTVALDGM